MTLIKILTILTLLLPFAPIAKAEENLLSLSIKDVTEIALKNNQDILIERYFSKINTENITENKKLEQ